MIPLFRTGRHKDIEISDLFKYSVYDDPVACSELLNRSVDMILFILIDKFKF